MIPYSGCTQFSPHIMHLLQACERIGAVRKWLGCHLSYHMLRQSRDILCWFHMWDYDPPPVLHMATYVSLVMIPYIDDVLILIMGMIGGRMQGLNVSLGSEILHVSYASCFMENIGKTMIATLDILFPYEVSHWHLMSTWEENFMEGLIGRHLVHEESLSHGGVTNEGGKEL